MKRIPTADEAAAWRKGETARRLDAHLAEHGTRCPGCGGAEFKCVGVVVETLATDGAPFGSVRPGVRTLVAQCLACAFSLRFHARGIEADAGMVAQREVDLAVGTRDQERSRDEALESLRVAKPKTRKELLAEASAITDPEERKKAFLAVALDRVGQPKPPLPPAPIEQLEPEEPKRSMAEIVSESIAKALGTKTTSTKEKAALARERQLEAEAKQKALDGFAP